MKVIHSLKSHRAVTALVGIAVVAVVLLAIPISYTKTTGYQAALEIADATGVDLDAVAGEFSKAMDADGVKLTAGPRGVRILADVPVRSAGTLKAIASGFARALTERGVTATADVKPVTERITGNVYAAAANEIVEIRVNSEGLTDEEIEAEIRAQIEAAGFEACMVDVQTGDGEKRIEIGIQQCADAGDDCALTPISISIDGMEPPPGGELMTQKAIELRIAADGMTLEEAEAAAREQLEAMGLEVTDIDIEACGDYYRVRVGDVGDACCPGGAGTVLGAPKTESKTLGEIKKEFTD